jgi:WD repeat-containing protein 26
MLKDKRLLNEQAQWDGANGQSRHELLSELSSMFIPLTCSLTCPECISPTIMIPEHRLSDLLHQAKRQWTSRCLYHNSAVPVSLYVDHSCGRHDFPDQPYRALSGHENEVWFLAFSADGSLLATAGGDKRVIVWDVRNDFERRAEFDTHGAGVCFVVWDGRPGFEARLLSCTREPDKAVRLWDLEVRTLAVRGEANTCRMGSATRS